MVEPTAPEQTLWEYDVDVTKKGTFSIMARSLEEAEAVVNNMGQDELESRARWFSCEGEVSY